MTVLLVSVIPGFIFPGMLTLLAVVVVALSCGAGPSLLAVVVGAGLLYFTVLSPPFTWRLSRLSDLLALALWVLVGLAMSLLASRAERARRAAQAATRHRDVFLSAASHELRTPLTSIQGRAQLLARRLDRAEAGGSSASDLVATARPLVAGIEQGARRLARLVDELLDGSRAQSRKLALRLAPTDLTAVVREAVDEQRQQHPQRGLYLDLPARPVPVVADADRIGQVVTNFLTNALKYSPEDRPILVAVQVETGRARVSVRDAGPGLPPEEQAQVWEQYHQAPGIVVASGSSVGLGLGLYISRQIVQAHPGGQVGVESALGAGSTFWFSVPLAATSAARDTDAETTPEAGA
jgi:signal transduction histidine kinase